MKNLKLVLTVAQIAAGCSTSSEPGDAGQEAATKSAMVLDEWSWLPTTATRRASSQRRSHGRQPQPKRRPGASGPPVVMTQARSAAPWPHLTCKMTNSIRIAMLAAAAVILLGTSCSSRSATQYVKVEDPKELGLALSVSVRGDVTNADLVNVRAEVDDFSVSGKKIELLNRVVVADAQGSWIVTKAYGRVKVSCGGSNGVCELWLTPAQRAGLKALYDSSRQ
jgi:hypothetical protein